MSTTDIYKIKQNGDVCYYESIPNAWRGAMYIWKSLSEKYHTNDTLFTYYETLYDLYNHNPTQMKTYDRITFGTTLDYMCVFKKNFNQIIDSFTKFDQHYHDSNLPEQIDIIKKLKLDDDCIGITWVQTSVCDDMWEHKYIETNDYNGISIPYNIFKGNKHRILVL